VHDQKRAFGGRKPVPCGPALPGQALRLGHPIIGKNQYAALGLAPSWQAKGICSGQPLAQLFEQGPEPLAESFVRKTSSRQLLIKPGLGFHFNLWPLGAAGPLHHDGLSRIQPASRVQGKSQSRTEPPGNAL
jgi:hypothetical protein